MMAKGFAQEWSTIIKDTLSIRDVRSESLLEYYQPLSEFLNSQLGDKPKQEDELNEEYYVQTDDKNPDVDEYDFSDNSESEKEKFGTSPEPEIATEKAETIEEKPEEENNDLTEPHEGGQQKDQDNPFLVAKDSNEASPAASSSDTLGRQGGPQTAEAPVTSKMPYAYIGLGILILIIVILAVVVGRKRYKHKKELERERRDGTA